MTGATTSRPVVTLWEAYGSGAATIGPAVADALGVTFIGQAYSSEEVEVGSERQDESLLSRVLTTLGRSMAAADTGVFSGAVLSQGAIDNIKMVRHAVAEGAVILGRNATVILADVPGVLHVKLDGPLEQRVARGSADAGIDLARARTRQAREDQVRAEMSLRVHNWDPRSNDRYDVVLNTVQLPDHKVVEMILASYHIKAACSDTAG